MCYYINTTFQRVIVRMCTLVKDCQFGISRVNYSDSEMIIDRGEAEVDYRFRRVNILTITLSGMYYLFYHTEIIECIYYIDVP